MSTVLKYLFLPLTIGLFLAGCMPSKDKKTNWSITLDRDEKSPYGSFLAYHSMPYYFPGARIENISRKFRYTHLDDNIIYRGDSTSVMVMLGLKFYVSDEEWLKLKAFAGQGNELFILCSTLDNKIATELNCNLSGGEEETALTDFYNGDVNVNALHLISDSNKKYGFKGRSLEGYFDLGTTGKPQEATADTTLGKIADSQQEEQALSTENDTLSTTEYVLGKPEILGANHAHPDFIRYAYGNGHITLHAAPLVLSNYFILQEENRGYMNAIWHSFPANTSHIYWNEYYKRTVEASDMSVLMKYPATRWAIIIAISILIIYVLFGIKRKQRIIPVIKPAANASASFVETIGRLYYNKGNHANLAEKMILHFLEWVRTYYYLDTSALNENFIKQLVSKSGKSEAAIQELVAQIHEVRLNPGNITPDYLYDLHRQIQSFYK